MPWSSYLHRFICTFARWRDEGTEPSSTENLQRIYFIVYLFSFSRPILCSTFFFFFSRFNFNRHNRVHHRYVRMFDYSIKIVNSLFSLDKNVQNSFLFPSIHITCKYLQCLINVCINIIGFTSLASYAADAALTFSWIVFRLVQITSSTQRLSPLLAHHRRYFKINLYLLFFFV